MGEESKSNAAPPPPIPAAAAPRVLGYGTPTTGRRRDPVNLAGATGGGVMLVMGLLANVIRMPGAGRVGLVLALGGCAMLGLVAATRGGRERRPWRWRAVCLAAIPVVAITVGLILLSSAGSVARNTADRVRCASNLRQINLGVQVYANNNRGLLPPDLPTILVAVDLPGEIFVCPSTRDTPAAGASPRAVAAALATPGHCSYVLAAPLPPTAKSLTPEHVLAYEPLSNHDGAGMTVVFGDGHTRFVDRADAQHLLAELKAGHNPPRPAGPTK